MPRGKRTDPVKAATAAAMGDLGYQSGQIADAVGLPQQTVGDIIAGRSGWEQRLKGEAFQAWRLEQKKIMQAGSVELAKKALKQIEAKLPLASAAQSAVIYGVLRDKERLDAGESTENVAHIHRHKIEAMDELGRKLMASLIEPGKDRG